MLNRIEVGYRMLEQSIKTSESNLDEAYDLFQKAFKIGLKKIDSVSKENKNLKKKMGKLLDEVHEEIEINYSELDELEKKLNRRNNGKSSKKVKKQKV